MRASLLCLVLILCLLGYSYQDLVTFELNTTDAIITVYDFSSSFTLDYWYPNISLQTYSWENSSAIILDLNNDKLIKYTKDLSPAILRIGGTTADSVIYDFPNPPVSKYNGTSYYCPGMLCLTKNRFKEIMDFCRKTNIKLVFGFNEKNGRYVNNSLPWDTKNTFDMIEFIKNEHFFEDGLIYGFELGNEVNWYLTPEQVVEDHKILRNKINELWPDERNRPLFIGPDYVFANSEFYPPIINSGVLDILTYHNYDAIGTDDDLLEEMLTPAFYQSHINNAKFTLSEVQKSKYPEMPIIMGEGAAAAMSGKEGVTDRFISSFYYLDNLASLAVIGIKAQFRQALVGGFYTLLSRDESHKPNSDYYVSYLWNKLVGNKIINITSNEGGNDEVRIYSQCSKEYNGGVVIEIINLRSVTVEIKSKNFDWLSRRYEYRLTAEELNSTDVMLNGEILNGDIDKKKTISLKDDLVIDPYSVNFFVYSDANVKMCYFNDSYNTITFMSFVPAIISLVVGSLLITGIVFATVWCKRRQYTKKQDTLLENEVNVEEATGVATSEQNNST